MNTTETKELGQQMAGLDQRLTSVEQRLTGVEQRLTQLEAGSKYFATKSDVARLEAEVKANMATKDDLHRLEQKIDNAQAQTTKEMDKIKIWFLSTTGAIAVANITIIGVMFVFLMQNNT